MVLPDDWDPVGLEALRCVVRDAIVRQELATLALPHVMVICSPSGPVAVHGPYADALAALEAAQTEHDAEVAELGPEAARRYSVAAIEPPVPALASSEDPLG